MDQSNGGWLVSDNGQQSGPFSETELLSRAKQGAFSPSAHVWRDGMVDWIPLGQQFPSAVSGGGGMPGGLPPAPANQFGGGQFGAFSGAPVSGVSGPHLAGRRVGAWFIDFVILILINCCAILPVFMLLGGGTQTQFDPENPWSAFQTQSTGQVVASSIIGFIMSLLWAAKDGIMNGQSPGKKVFKLRTMNVNTGQPATLVDSIKRNFYALVPTNITFLCIGCFGALFRIGFQLVCLYQLFSSPDGRRLADNWAGTLVVEE